MKQIILIGVLTGLLTAVIPLRAQVAPRDSDARKGSRLELGRTSAPPKTTTNRLATQRFSIVSRPTASGPDRSMTMNKNTAINEHYRSLLMTRSASKTVRVGSPENSSVVVSEIRSAVSAPENQSENLLYNSDKLWVSNVYPNPADNVAELDYQFSGSGEAKLVLLNILGTPVSSHDLDRNDRKVRIATRTIDSGYYLYQLSVDGKKVATKRLLVRHQ